MSQDEWMLFTKGLYPLLLVLERKPPASFPYTYKILRGSQWGKSLSGQVESRCSLQYLQEAGVLPQPANLEIATALICRLHARRSWKMDGGSWFSHLFHYWYRSSDRRPVMLGLVKICLLKSNSCPQDLYCEFLKKVQQVREKKTERERIRHVSIH